MAQHNDLGKLGEERTVQYLQQKGYKILQRNWYYEKSEIDIIACNEAWIAFVEVKTRTSQQWGNPEDFVTPAKMKRMVDAADFYIKQYNISLLPRFDIAGVVFKNNSCEIDYIEDAFLPSVD